MPLAFSGKFDWNFPYTSEERVYSEVITRAWDEFFRASIASTLTISMRET